LNLNPQIKNPNDSYFRSIPRQKFEYVQELLRTSINKIKKALDSHSDYDTSSWRIDEKSENQNVIQGVLKKGEPIIILIRPANSGLIKFYLDFEKETLIKDNAELWASSEKTEAQRVSFGQVLLWNNIN
jgi:hypothetical protein